MHELGSVRRRWRARRAAGARSGSSGARLKGLIQRQQINLAMVASRVGDAPDHPDLVKQRDLVRALKAEYAALVAGTRPEGGPATIAPADTPGPPRGADPRASGPPPPAPPPTPGWQPTHLVPDGGMAAWAAPNLTSAPMVSLGGFLELVVIERVGDWARVAAVNGWSGWVDGRRLIPRR
jgi:hypothetical protein